MDDNLGLKEEELFNLITGWVKNGYPGRASLLNHVRYQNMNTDFKKKVIDSMEDVNLKNEISSLKLRTLTNKAIIGLNPRNPNEIVLAIGGWKTLDSWGASGPCQHIEIGANYGVLTQPWKKIKASHIMPVKCAYHGIGLVNNIMYQFGGYSSEEGHHRSTLAFDTIKKVSTLGFLLYVLILLYILIGNFPLNFKYRTRAIITRGLYTFYPLFEVHLCTVTFGLMYG